MRGIGSRRGAVFGFLLGAVAGCPNVELCFPPGSNSNDNQNNGHANANGNANDNADPCRGAPQATANPAAASVMLAGDASVALIRQTESVAADGGLLDETRVVALDFEALAGTGVPVPIEGAFSIVANAAAAAWVDFEYDLFAVDIGHTMATRYYDGAPLLAERIAGVSHDWIVFYIAGQDAIQVIDRRDGTHRTLAGAPAGSAFWPQTLHGDELIRFQPPGGVTTTAPRIDVGEIVAVSLISGAQRILASTQNISLTEAALPAVQNGLYWRQVAPDGLQRIMRFDLLSGAVTAVFEQPEIVADRTQVDRVALVDGGAEHVFLRRFRQTPEPIPGHGQSQFITHEFGFYERRDLGGHATEMLHYDYRFGVTGTTGTPPVAARMFGERVLWRDAVVGDYVVTTLADGRMCRVDPFRDAP